MKKVKSQKSPPKADPPRAEKYKMTNQNSKIFISSLMLVAVVVLILLVPGSAGAKAEKKSVTCQFGQTSHTVECYPGGLFGGRMRPECVCCGDCQLSDALAFGLNLADLILKYLGVVALLLFVYGGVRWIFSGGNPKAIETGKAVVSGAVIGMVIVLAAFLIVRVLLEKLKVPEEYWPKEQKVTSWPACPVPPTADEPWCYGCRVGGADKGCQGNEVATYQYILNQLLCNCGTENGEFGSQTKSCTERFQQANSLNVDGIVGPETYAKYRSDNPLPNDCQ